MHETPIRNETQQGLAEFKKRLTAKGVAILEQGRPWPGRMATYFAVGSSERQTDIGIADTFLDDLLKTKENQATVDSYALAVAGRMKCGPPDLFYCESGIPFRLSIRWPLQASGIQTWILTDVVRQPDGHSAKCALQLEGLNRTIFDDVRHVVNRIRTAIDAGELTFYRPDFYQEKYQQPKGILDERSAQPSNREVEKFLAGKTYVLGFLVAEGHDAQVWTQDPWDAEYLGISDREFRLATRTLRAQGLVDLDSSLEYARPTDKLLARESDESPEIQPVQKLSRLTLPTKEKVLSDIQAGLDQQSALGVVVIDLDNFKQLNDSKGHSAGDECLDRVVNLIGTILGRRGKLYRWGAGDEFVAVLPDVSTQEALATAERVRQAIEQHNAGGDVQVTSSIGVCATDAANIRSATDFLNFADQSMYKSKQAGRNRVTKWG